jgi:hypothetical protein
MLDDAAIRTAFHAKLLRAAHRSPGTLVVDEFGIDHGSRRADIAVINGRMTGYEIKSDVDSLVRLRGQVAGYSRVFDYATVVVTDRHLRQVTSVVPAWWGIVGVSAGARRGIRFRTVRRGSPNPRSSAIALARLLWRHEVIAVLKDLGLPGKRLRTERSLLYRVLVGRLATEDVARLVRDRLRGRSAWPGPSQLSPGDGSYRRTATS